MSKKNLHKDITYEDSTQNKGVRHGFYQTDDQLFGNGVMSDGYIPGNNYGDDVGIDELEKGGKIKKKK